MIIFFSFFFFTFLGDLDILIVKGMLREGWSNILVSVIGFLDPILSLAAVDQISGRGARRVYVPPVGHPSHQAVGNAALRQLFGLNGNLAQSDLDEHDQNCYIVAHEAFNMLPVLQQVSTGNINYKSQVLSDCFLCF